MKPDEGNSYSDRFLREGTNAISYLQVIQNDFARLESETREADSEALRILTSSLGKPWKVLGTVWRPTLAILIVVRTQSESSVNTLSVIQDIDQRICPTVVQAGVYVTLEDYEDTLHKWLGRINSCMPVL